MPLATVRETIRRHAMLAGGETVLVAVSGGADSTALLHLLTALAPELGLRLRALHVDHQLRSDSARDAERVTELGRRLGVPVDVVRVEVGPRGSPEEAARVARYAALETHADRIGAGRIALGHTADDQAETVLMRLIQGAGLRGLAGIPPVRGRLIRPLLEVRRADLVAELGRVGLGWVEDPTNRDTTFLRNRIRHEILPTLGASSEDDLVATLARVARQARGAVEALERLGAAELARLATIAGDAITLPRPRLAALPRSMAVEVLRQAVAGLGGAGPLRGWAHRGLARVLATPPPRGAFRFGGILVEVSGAWVRLSRGRGAALPARELPVPGRVVLAEVGLVVESRVLPAEGYEIPRVRQRIAFDADELPRPLRVRGRRPGDRFAPFGGPGERRLKAFLIDARIPRWERDRLPLVEAGGQIVWVAGFRRGALGPVTARSREIVELALRPLAETARPR